LLKRNEVARCHADIQQAELAPAFGAPDEPIGRVIAKADGSDRKPCQALPALGAVGTPDFTADSPPKGGVAHQQPRQPGHEHPADHVHNQDALGGSGKRDKSADGQPCVPRGPAAEPNDGGQNREGSRQPPEPDRAVRPRVADVAFALRVGKVVEFRERAMDLPKWDEDGHGVLKARTAESTFQSELRFDCRAIVVPLKTTHQQPSGSFRDAGQ